VQTDGSLPVCFLDFDLGGLGGDTQEFVVFGVDNHFARYFLCRCRVERGVRQGGFYYYSRWAAWRRQVLVGSAEMTSSRRAEAVAVA
jgi:hypothetical protein